MNDGHHHSDPSLTAHNVLSTRYIQVASLTLVFHDHLLTLPKEIDLVWRGTHSRSWPRLLFFAARYACPMALFINTFALMYTGTSAEFCRAWLFFHGWSGFVFFGGTQVISQLRLWAMYRSGKLLVVMSFFSLLSLIAMGLIEGLGFVDLRVTADPVPGIHICGPLHLPHYVWAFWLPPILIETVAIVLVAYKAGKYFRNDAPKEWLGSRLTLSIAQHSVFYFVVVLGVYLANLVIWSNLPINSFEIAIPLTYALPSVAGNRMLLSLRNVFYHKHALLPGHDDTISLTIVNHDRGLTVHTHNPLKEFDSFFGETSRPKMSM